MSAYIFVHFIGEESMGEQIYFSVSRDGLFWNDLNNGKPVLVSQLGEKGVRDPFLVRHPKTGRFYLIATDLCMHTRKSWSSAVHEGSRDIIIWESDNLTEWKEARAYTIGQEGVGCVWAPEAVYDEEAGAFMVFFASFTRADGLKCVCREDEPGDKHIIYRSYTDDFVNFTKAERYIERSQSIIDTTIIRDCDNYYRFSKDEDTKCLILEKGTSLEKDAFEVVKSDTLDGLFGLEGPECFALPDGRWCLIADRFAAGKGYMPIVIDYIGEGRMHVLSEEEYDMGRMKKRHGGIMEITDEEYENLVARYGIA